VRPIFHLRTLASFSGVTPTATTVFVDDMYCSLAMNS
jgi:hypothetical protein